MATTTVQTTRPPLWRDIRVLRGAGQLVFAVAVIGVLYQLYLNLEFGLNRIGIDLSFDFLRTRAGFSIKEGIEYSPNESYRKAFTVGAMNTVRVALTGIVLASVLGLIMGIARLSPNWLMRKIAQVYVEVIRNTPVLIQIIIWYVGVILALPVIGGGFSVFGIGFLSNRGAAVLWPRTEEGLGIFGFFLIAGVVVASLVWLWRTRVNEATGDPSYRWIYGGGAFVVVAAIGYFLTGSPVFLDIPEPERFGYAGGTVLSPEFTALLLGLVVYTGAFIAEIVRGSILAVSKGQKEAAEALGFTPGQQLRLVVLPQAMRIAIPPLNSQYLNLTKNSSLAVAIGFPEIAQVGKTMINQSARSFQVFVMIILTYLVLSLIISFFMNLLNRAVTTKGEPR